MNTKRDVEEPIQKERLQKYLANCGVASRRKAEEYIEQGKIQVNGQTAKLGTKVDPEKDIVTFEGRIIKLNTGKIYILLNKPIGYVSTSKDQFERDTVMDLVKEIKTKLVTVGRLDMYTSGALILTNDGDFVYYITHPKHEVEKTYTVTLKGKITNEEVQKLRDGVTIQTGKREEIIQNEGNEFNTSKARVKILKIDEEKEISRLEIVIHEGKNREVRKMCEAIGKKVIALHRSKIGNIDVKNLPLGKWRYLTKREIESLGYK